MPKLRDADAGASIALRAFAVLETIAAATASMSLDEVTQAIALPKTTTLRILNMLQTAGLLRREPASKRYAVGPRLTAFAIDLWRNATLRAQWRRALKVAVEEIGESCNLTLLEDNQVLYLERVETTKPLRLHIESGTRMPLHCSASGKLFLSRMSPEKARQLLGKEPYKRYSKTTITTFAELEPELAKIRKTLVGTHDSEMFPDSVAIAVPIIDSQGNVFAAVAAHAPSSRMNIRGIMRFLPTLRRAVEVISATMSPHPETQAVAVTAARKRKGKSEAALQSKGPPRAGAREERRVRAVMSS